MSEFQNVVLLWGRCRIQLDGGLVWSILLDLLLGLKIIFLGRGQSSRSLMAGLRGLYRLQGIKSGAAIYKERAHPLSFFPNPTVVLFVLGLHPTILRT